MKQLLEMLKVQQGPAGGLRIDGQPNGAYRVVEPDGTPAGGDVNPVDGGGMDYSNAMKLAEEINGRRKSRNEKWARENAIELQADEDEMASLGPLADGGGN